MEYTGLNDYEVLYMIKENDEIAYNVMYDKYHPIISSIAKEYSKNFKHLDIEYDDLYQEGLCALNNAIKGFKETNNCLFYTYLLICVKREMEKYIKAKGRQKHKILTDSISIDQDISSTNLHLVDVIPDKRVDLQDNLMKNIEYKKILDLKYDMTFNQSLIYEMKLNNFTNSEIAILLDVSYRVVDNVLKKVKRKIKKFINEEEQSVLYL